MGSDPLSEIGHGEDPIPVVFIRKTNDETRSEHILRPRRDPLEHFSDFFEFHSGVAKPVVAQ